METWIEQGQQTQSHVSGLKLHVIWWLSMLIRLMHKVIKPIRWRTYCFFWLRGQFPKFSISNRLQNWQIKSKLGSHTKFNAICTLIQFCWLCMIKDHFKSYFERNQKYSSMKTWNTLNNTWKQQPKTSNRHSKIWNQHP